MMYYRINIVINQTNQQLQSWIQSQPTENLLKQMVENNVTRNNS